MRKALSLLDFPTIQITEGKTKLIVPRLEAFVKSPSDYAPSKAPVFYNPVMELNRDIAVIALQAYRKKVKRKITVCEPLASCGVRGVRFANEVEGVKKVVMSDISERATQTAKLNVQLNEFKKKIIVLNKDANLVLTSHGAPRKRFDAIDVDPFGSSVSYMDSAVRALRNNGLLALTATDMAALCGVHPKACIRKYGGKPLRTEYCHELAIRLLAGCAATVAAKHGIGFDVVFSHSTAHYVRLYSIIEYGAQKADESLSSIGYVLHCFTCFHRESTKSLQLAGHSMTCSECGSRLNVAGPLWIGRLFDSKFCESMENELKQTKLSYGERIARMLTLARGEADVTAGYYVIDRICDKLNLPVPSVKRVLAALKKEGFQAVQTLSNSRGIKTDAPAKKVQEAIRSTACTNR